MNSDFAIMLMKLCREGYKEKKLDKYKEIYQATAELWILDWEKQYHTEQEKNEMYEKLKRMEI